MRQEASVNVTGSSASESTHEQILQLYSVIEKCFSTLCDVSGTSSPQADQTIGVKQHYGTRLLMFSSNTHTLLKQTDSPHFSFGKCISCLCGHGRWRTSAHCSLRSHVGVCGWLELRHDFHSNGALKIPMMPRLRTRLTTSAPMVPRKEGIPPWATSHALRDIMSAITPSIWKWVPTTALTWKSWWLWPEGKTTQGTRQGSV